MHACGVAAQHMKPSSAGPPHVPKGEFLLAWHVSSFAENQMQPEYANRYRLTERQGSARVVRKPDQGSRGWGRLEGNLRRPLVRAGRTWGVGQSARLAVTLDLFRPAATRLGG